MSPTVERLWAARRHPSFLIGGAIAAVCLYVVVLELRSTTISIVITPRLVAAGFGTMVVCAALGSLLSLRALVSTDPGEAFRT
jgi:hypothetical protein